MKYKMIRTLYRTHKITAAQVWEYADNGDITEQQAILICGPRPKENADGN